LLEGVLLQRAATFDPGGLAIGIGDSAGEHGLVFAHHQLQFPFLYQLIAVLDHGFNFVGGIDMHEGKRDVAEKGLARQPQQNGGILSNAPEHCEILESVKRLAQDVYALVFEFG